MNFNLNINLARCIADMLPHFFISDQIVKGQGNQKASWNTTDEQKSLVLAYKNNSRMDKYKNFIASVNSLSIESNYELRKKILTLWLVKMYEVDQNLCEQIIWIVESLDTARNENKYATVNMIVTNRRADSTPSLDSTWELITGVQYSQGNYIKLSNDAKRVLDICCLDSSNSNFKYLPKELNAYIGFSDEMLYGVLYCENGDVFLINNNTLMASRRNQKWFCHDFEILKKLFTARFEEKVIGKRFLQVAYYLSYKKKGGLLVYCPTKNDKSLENDILNEDKSNFKNSFLYKFNTLNKIINVYKDSIYLHENKVELLGDLMSLDGCIVVNKEGISHIGALVAFQDEVARKDLTNLVGARSATTTYVDKLGLFSLKISQDGTITLFTSYYGNRIKLEFM